MQQRRKLIMPDTFRKTYVKLSDENTNLIRRIKATAEVLEELFLEIESSREMSLAKTNLEQSIMWATKAIVLFNEKGSNE